MKINPFEIIKERYRTLGGDYITKVFVDVYNAQFTIKDLGVEHRWIIHWEKEGLLFNPKKEKDEKWRKFNTIEFVWLRLIVELREFKVPLKVIKKLKEKLTLPPTEKELESAMAISKIGQKLLNEPEFDYEFEKVLAGQSLLQRLTIDTLVSGTNIKVMINKEGKCIPYMEEYIMNELTKEYFVTAFRENHVSISISNIILKLFNVLPPKTLLNTYQLISEKQKTILDMINDPKLTHVEILYRNHKIDKLKLTSPKKVDVRSRIKENVINNGIQSISMKFNNGSIKYSEETITYQL